MAAIQRDCLRIFINTSKLISIVVLSSLVVLSGWQSQNPSSIENHFRKY